MYICLLPQVMLVSELTFFLAIFAAYRCWLQKQFLWIHWTSALLSTRLLTCIYSCFLLTVLNSLFNHIHWSLQVIPLLCKNLKIICHSAVKVNKRFAPLLCPQRKNICSVMLALLRGSMRGFAFECTLIRINTGSVWLKISINLSTINISS